MRVVMRYKSGAHRGTLLTDVISVMRKIEAEDILRASKTKRQSTNRSGANWEKVEENGSDVKTNKEMRAEPSGDSGSGNLGIGGSETSRRGAQRSFY